MVEEELGEEREVLAEELVLEAIDFPDLVGVVRVDFGAGGVGFEVACVLEGRVC